MDQARERCLVLASKQIWEDWVRGLGNRTKAGKDVRGFENRRQNEPKASSVQVAGGQTVTPSQSRGQSLFSDWCRRAWVAGLPRG